jgi:hypothetical protein
MKTAGFTGLLLLSVLLFVSGAGADLRDDALSAVLRCADMSDKGQRLVCYDSAAVRVPGALRAPAASAAPTTSIVPSAATPAAPAPRKQQSGGFLSGLLGLGPKRAPQTNVAQFGSESIANGGALAFSSAIEGDTVNQISARLTAYEFANGYVTVTLDNGQEWRQAGSDRPLGHLVRPAGSYVAVIRRGSDGDSYAMKLGNLAGSVAVRRVR